MALLKRVSRSFYLSIRILPRAMRRGISIGYLLARASDTIADAQKNPTLLDAFEAALNQKNAGEFSPNSAFHEANIHLGELQLMAKLNEIFKVLHALPPEEADLIREVIATILSGQRLDMQRFACADANHIASLNTMNELDDYMWRVAGCVGRFWTRLGFLTLGEQFSTAPAPALEALGVRFGKGLQLVNILRDSQDDLAHGRDYLPAIHDASNPGGPATPTHSQARDPRAERILAWIPIARAYLECGIAYASTMQIKRLHVAVKLPALIGLDTLNLIEKNITAKAPVKISRRRIWHHLWCACKSSLSAGLQSDKLSLHEPS